MITHMRIRIIEKDWQAHMEAPEPVHHPVASFHGHGEQYTELEEGCGHGEEEYEEEGYDAECEDQYY